MTLGSGPQARCSGKAVREDRGFGLGHTELGTSVRVRNSEKRLVVHVNLGVVGIWMVFKT